MKTKHILLLVLTFCLSYNVEAQLLKKLKQKAEQAAERTILRKTDETVSKKTEEVIDDVANPNTDKQKDTKKEVELPESDKKQPSQNGVASSNTQSLEADLHFQNSVQPEVTQLGGSVTFNMAVNNKGPAASNDIVCKVVIPKSYEVANISVSQGNYDKNSQLWTVGTLDAWKRATLTAMVIVLDDKDSMTTGEIISCSTKDPDSTPNNGIDTNGNGLIIDDQGDEDDGDGQDVKIKEIRQVVSTNGNGEDIKMMLEHKKDKIISFLDFDTMAMRMEYHSKGKNPDPVYWDKDGYIYSGEKGQYYKIPFDQVKSMGKNMVKMFSQGSEGMPGAFVPKVNGKEVNLEFPNEPIVYNGYELHVYPNKYPMVEWAFVYHPKIFRGADDVKEESVTCRGKAGCTKFTSTAGESVGSTVLFDHKDRLAEITNPDGASAVYTYEPTTVTLPAAQVFNFNFGN
ncbi:DUF11 domain-containing protein [Litoribaculum gwangyangense]|uniref:DUF11 domain-containing protein n=1 Tax=Litoribaculum gwangyangense TaxID=1130722 RepID=A0ABP9CFH5_9FLAO